ncbi:hypothetical protein PS3A_42580 [Pseudomonas sp. 3A(2025)]
MPELAPANACSHSHFQACVNGQPLQVNSLLGRLLMRPERSQTTDHWVWKIIADGRVGRRRTSIGLFFDRDLQPGTYPLVGNPHIQVVYNESPHWQSVIYYSTHLQSGSLTLLEVDSQRQQVQGHFEFGISAMDFEVSQGHFALRCA